MPTNIQAQQDQVCASVRAVFNAELIETPGLLITFTEDHMASTVCAWVANVGMDIANELDRLEVSDDVAIALRLRLMAWTSMFSERVSKAIGQ